MTRPYSPDLLAAIKDRSFYALGKELGRVCVKANLPAGYVAQVFDTSRQTIHSWFRGGAIRKSKHRKIEVFIELVKEDIEAGILPCKNLRDARAYLRDMVGKPITTVLPKAPD